MDRSSWYSIINSYATSSSFLLPESKGLLLLCAYEIGYWPFKYGSSEYLKVADKVVAI